MKIYTKKGDAGSSTLIGEANISKEDPVFHLLGTLDELNACLGFIQKTRIKEVREICIRIQNKLFNIGAVIANTDSKESDYYFLTSETQQMETEIDRLQEKVPLLSDFILPGGTETSSRLHMARAICRRLERVCVTFYTHSSAHGNEFVLKYINRLSDLLFVLARYANYKVGVADQIWDKNA